MGYKTHVTETCDETEEAVHLITHVETTEAVKPDNLVPEAPRALALQPQAVQELIQTHRQKQETVDFRKQYALRSGIEGTLSQAVRVCEMRCSRYIGLAKTHLQMVATAAAIDLYRLYDWLIGTPREQTRVSAFATLAPATATMPKSWRF